MVNKNDRIFVAGHTGLIGSAIIRYLKSAGFENLILKGHAELDLTDSSSVNIFFENLPN